MPAFLRRMIPALIGASPAFLIGCLLLMATTTRWASGLALGALTFMTIAVLIAMSSRRIPGAFDTVADEFNIRDDADRTSEFRLGLWLGWAALIAASVLTIFWRSF